MKTTAIGYIEGEAEGAWPLGTVVEKKNSQPDDGTPDGMIGTVLSSFDVSELLRDARFAYFIEWQNGLVVFVADTNNDGTPRLELAP